MATVGLQDAYWSNKCKKIFKDPPPGTVDIEDIIDISGKQPEGFKSALTIVAETDDLIGGGKHGSWASTTWKFFATEYGQAIGCRTDTVQDERNTRQDVSKQMFPLGVYGFELFGERCEYRNNGHNPGRLLCGNKNIECTVDPRSTNPPKPNADAMGNYLCEGKFLRHSMFTCPY